MTDRSIVLQKLAVLRDHVGRVRRRRPDAPERLADDLAIRLWGEIPDGLATLDAYAAAIARFVPPANA